MLLHTPSATLPVEDVRRGSLYAADYGLLAIWIAASTIFCRGFFFPDEAMLNGYNSRLHGVITIALQLISAACAVGTAFLYVLVRRRIVPFTAIALVLLGLLAAALSVYPIAVDLLWGRTRGVGMSEYNTFLQENPPPFLPRTASSLVRPIRIVFLGGSTTGWGDTQGTQWTSRLENILSKTCPNCEVYNQGHDWYTSLHSLINYATNIRPHRPDVVVAMHGINDLMHNIEFGRLSNGSFRSDYGHYLGPMADFFKRKPPLATVLKQLRLYWYAPSRVTISADSYPGAEAFRRNLNTLADLVALDGGRLVLLTEASIYKENPSQEERNKMVMFNFHSYGPGAKWSYESVFQGMALYNNIVRDVARTRGAGLVDIDSALPKSLEYFLDDVHFTDLSHPIVARTVARSLSETVEAVKKNA